MESRGSTGILAEPLLNNRALGLGRVRLEVGLRDIVRGPP